MRHMFANGDHRFAGFLKPGTRLWHLTESDDLVPELALQSRELFEECLGTVGVLRIAVEIRQLVGVLLEGKRIPSSARRSMLGV
jgi:hypothetical protein